MFSGAGNLEFLPFPFSSFGGPRHQKDCHRETVLLKEKGTQQQTQSAINHKEEVGKSSSIAFADVQSESSIRSLPAHQEDEERGEHFYTTKRNVVHACLRVI